MPRSLFIRVFPAVMALCYVSLIIFRDVYIDEAWLGEMALWLARKGYVHSELFRGMLGYDQPLFVYHKLHIWTTAVWIQLTGFSLISMRSLNLLFVGLTFWGLWKSLDNQGHRHYYFGILLSIYLLHPALYHFGMIVRPETMLATAGIILFVLLKMALEKDSLRLLMLGAVMAGVCALIHLNGLGFMFAGGVLLLFKRRWQWLFIFSAISSMVATAYFLDILLLKPANGFAEFLHQWNNDPALIDYPFYWYTPFVNLLTEHRRLFHSQSEIISSVIWILSTIYLLRDKELRKKYSTLLIYTLGAFAGIGMIAQAKTTHYYSLYIPEFSLICFAAVVSIFERRDAIWKKIYLSLFGLSFLAALFSVGVNWYEYDDQIGQHTEILQPVPTGETVLSPYNIILNEYENYQFWSGREDKNPEESLRFNLSWAKTVDVNYVVIRVAHTFPKKEFTLPQASEGYSLVKRTTNYFLYVKEGAELSE
ncbi:MAG: glycosyltransferase family 39 protein [Bacteroidota bacterium]